MLTKEQVQEFEQLAKPLVKWLNENGNPHSMIVVECDSAKVYGGECGVPISEFIKD